MGRTVAALRVAGDAALVLVPEVASADEPVGKILVSALDEVVEADEVKAGDVAGAAARLSRTVCSVAQTAAAASSQNRILKGQAALPTQ